MAENFKGELIAALAVQGQSPEFRLGESGPPHARSFQAEVWCGDQLLGRGIGSSKREAERHAAREALAELREEELPAAGAESQRPAVQGEVWPLYPAVLAEALAVADSRLPSGTPLPEVAAEADALYRELLAGLGHGPAQTTVEE